MEERTSSKLGLNRRRTCLQMSWYLSMVGAWHQNAGEAMQSPSSSAPKQSGALLNLTIQPPFAGSSGPCRNDTSSLRSPVCASSMVRVSWTSSSDSEASGPDLLTHQLREKAAAPAPLSAWKAPVRTCERPDEAGSPQGPKPCVTLPPGAAWKNVPSGRGAAASASVQSARSLTGSPTGAPRAGACHLPGMSPATPCAAS
mmetsp:Transcript_40294/g.95747  ORF Transcript_40294/g.95747 Transcript_40294/m.95747 type:complete len:200 (+) Transcript_40294:1447-2046(+)